MTKTRVLVWVVSAVSMGVISGGCELLVKSSDSCSSSSKSKTGASSSSSDCTATTTTATATASPTPTVSASSTPVAPGTCVGLSYTTGMQLWLDAANLPLTHGASVSTWNDCNNASVTASQGSGAAQPAFSTTGGPNSKPYVYFNGTSSFMQVAANQLSIGSAATIVILARINDVARGTDQYLIDKSQSPDSFSLYQSSGGPWMSAIGAGNGGSMTFSYQDATWYLMTYKMSGTTAYEYVNGVYRGQGSIGAMSSNATDLYLFCNRWPSGQNLFTEGMLSEVMVYDSALSDTDRATVECYLNTKYNLGLSGCS